MRWSIIYVAMPLFYMGVAMVIQVIQGVGTLLHALM